MGCTNSTARTKVGPEEKEGEMVEKFSATAQGSGIMGDTHVQITGKGDWNFLIDEPIEDGGKNQGANPMQIFISSLVSCENEQAAVVAGEMKINLEKIDWTVDVDLNLAGFMGKDREMKQPFTATTIKATVTTDGTEEQVKELGESVGARCPIRRLLVNSGVTVESTFIKSGCGTLPETKAKEENEMVERFSATAQGSGIMGDTNVQITGTSWNILVDEPTEDGGKNKGPNPMQHFIASLVSCENEQAAVVAGEMFDALLMNKVTKIDWTVDVELNLAGFMGADLKLKQPFVSVVLTAAVTCPDGATKEQVKLLGKSVCARCPVLLLLKNSGVKVESTFIKAHI